MIVANTVLFTVTNNNNCKVGLPPTAYHDNFYARSTTVGLLDNVSLIAFSPDDQLYAVRGNEMYTGPMPSNPSQNWFQEAKRVGKSDWNQFKSIFFHPNGTLYGATHRGKLYQGPPPNNEHESWLYQKAQYIGTAGWNIFYALFFDPSGTLYGVTKDRFLKGKPPCDISHNWYSCATVIGLGSLWSVLTQFMAISPDGNLWCVSKEDGKIYKAPPPTHTYDDWISTARNLGVSYNCFKLMSFTRDRTIQNILNMEFLVDAGKIMTTNTELVAEQVYDNKESSISLDSTFSVNKSYEVTSTFTHEHGFSLAFGIEGTFQGGIPLIASGSLTLGVEMSTSHNWNFTKTNVNKMEFSNQFHFQVPPGKAVRQTALIQRAVTDVPYRAQIRTLLGNEVTINGTWKGGCYFNLHVKQADI